MIKLTKSDFEKILAHAVKELPDEACGLIAGTVEGGDKEIKKVYLLTNIDHSNEHFSLDSKEQLEAIKDMRKNGFVPLGNWHSVPYRAAKFRIHVFVLLLLFSDVLLLISLEGNAFCFSFFSLI